jgi:hypothetical protein
MLSKPTFGSLSVSSRLFLGCLLFAAAALTISLDGVVGCVQAQQLTSGSSSRKFRSKAVESVPFDMLTSQTQAKLKPVLNKPSLYRRLPVTAINCDPDYFRFLVRQPEVIVEIWKLMGVTKMETKRTGPYEIHTNDGAGTISDLELVYGDSDKHIFYGTGTYEGPLLRKKLSGRCVLVLQTTHETDESGKPRAVNQLDVFLRVDNVAAGMIARSLQPLVGPTADHNFTESLGFLQRLNETTVRNGAGVQMMGERLTLEPDVLTAFQKIAAVTYNRAIARESQVQNVRISDQQSPNQREHGSRRSR